MKRFGFVRLILCLGVLFFSIHQASAADATLSGDVSANSAHPSVNYGALSNLYVASGNTAFLQFNLSTLPAGTTSVQVSRATLMVFVNRVNTAGSVTVAPVTASWGEYSVTSATPPATGGLIGTLPVSVAGQFVAVDVTAQVQAWLNTPASNNRLALASGGADVLFDSKENDETSHGARLDITLVTKGHRAYRVLPEQLGLPGRLDRLDLLGRKVFRASKACRSDWSNWSGRSSWGDRHLQLRFELYCGHYVFTGAGGLLRHGVFDKQFELYLAGRWEYWLRSAHQ